MATAKVAAGGRPSSSTASGSQRHEAHPEGVLVLQHDIEEACRFCFDVLVAGFSRTPCPHPRFPNGQFPLFVTWDKVDSRGNSNLRGCIGNLSPISLHDGVKKYAAVSAFEDRRFSPIASHELQFLECSVTLLSDFEEAANYVDWQIGKHGMIINFQDDHGNPYNATYLPSVCAEQGWGKEECIDSLMRKAGYRGAISHRLRSVIKLTRYQGRKASIDYHTYRQHRIARSQWNTAWDSR